MPTKLLVSISIAFCILLSGGAADAFAQSVRAAKTLPKATPDAHPAPAPATVALEEMTILALSQRDGTAVIGLPARQMAVVKVGEQIPRSTAILRQVQPDKVVLEVIASNAAGKQLVWMHKGQGGAPGRIERLSRAPAPADPVAHAPLVQGGTLPQGHALAADPNKQ